MRTVWIKGAFVIGAVAAMAAPVHAQERFTLSGDRVAVYNLAGEVTIAATRGSAVVVEVTREGIDSDALRISHKQVAGWPSLVVGYPGDRIVYPRLGARSRSEFSVSDDGTFGDALQRLTFDENGFPRARNSSREDRRVRVSGSGGGFEGWADLRVLVPRGKTVALYLGAGRVDVSNVDGHVRVWSMSGTVNASRVSGSTWIETGSGSVRAENLSGHTSIHTGSGSIDAVGLRGGRLDLDTGSGSVEASELKGSGIRIDTGSGSVRLAAIDAETVRVNTGSGGITVNGVTARDLDLDTGSGSINGELLTDVRNASIETGSGGVTLRVPDSLGAEIVVRTGSGGISTDVPIQLLEHRRSYLRGRVGDGERNIRISTGSGSVRIRSRG